MNKNQRMVNQDFKNGENCQLAAPEKRYDAVPRAFRDTRTARARGMLLSAGAVDLFHSSRTQFRLKSSMTSRHFSSLIDVNRDVPFALPCFQRMWKFMAMILSSSSWTLLISLPPIPNSREDQSRGIREDRRFAVFSSSQQPRYNMDQDFILI